MFDTVQYDPYQDYSTSTGRFRCPVSGTYVFHVTVMDYLDTMEWYTQMVVNEEPVMDITAWKPYVTDSHTLMVGSNMCVVYCTSGDSVWTRLSYPTSGSVQFWGGQYDSFSGFLLHHNVSDNYCYILLYTLF